MEITLDQIKATAYDPDDIQKAVKTPCNRCNGQTETNLAYYKIFGNGTCRKCHHAYMCFLVLHESRKAAFQKKEKEKEVAQNQTNNLSNAFRSRYGIDWREHLNIALPHFEVMLKTGWHEPLQIYSLISEAKQNNYLTCESKKIEDSF